MTVTAVSPTAQKPKHHVTLSDGTTTVGLIAVKRTTDKNDEIITVPDENQITVAPGQPLAIQTSQGNSEYSDREWPYMTLVQEDWSGGRGSETFEDDRTRYYDGYRVNTWREGELMLGPQEKYDYSIREGEEFLHADVSSTESAPLSSKNLYGSNRYVSYKVTASANEDIDRLWLCAAYTGSPGVLTIGIYSDSGGEPDALLTDGSGTISKTTSGLDEGQFAYVEVATTATKSLTNTTVYHVVAIGHSGDSADNYWTVKTNNVQGSTTGNTSTDGSTWYTTTHRMMYRFRSDEGDEKDRWKFFEYKNSLYAYSQPIGSNSFLYINGDRGVADDNSGANISKVMDASKSWTGGEWANSIVLITKGPGSEETQPWRTISNNDTNYLTCDFAWNVTHTTATEYVILKSDEWTSVEDLGGYVTDHAVTDDYVYFARGETASLKLLRYRWYNNAGTATTSSDAENIDGKYLLSIHHPEEERDTLYIAQNDNDQFGVAVGKMKVPGTWGDLVYQMGKLVETDTPWADRSIANVTQTTDDQSTKITITNTFQTGLIAVKNLPEPVDITRANKLGMWLKTTDALGTDDLYLVYDDFVDNTGNNDTTGATTANELVEHKIASAVFHVDLRDAEQHLYTSCGECYDAFNESLYTFDAAGTDQRLSGADSTICVMSDIRYNDIFITLGTKNATAASTITTWYFDGIRWTTVTNTDGTADGGVCLAQNGSITFTPPIDWAQYTITADSLSETTGSGYTGTVVDNVTTYSAETSETEVSGGESFTGYPILIGFNKQLTDAITIKEIAVSRYNQNKIDLTASAIAADTWTYVVVDITPEHFPAPDDTRVQSVGLFIEDDQNANFNIMMRGGIDLLYDEPDWKPLPSESNITNMIAHNGNANEPRTNPWIFTEGAQLYEMQSQNNDVFVPMTIGEMGALRSANTGKAACVNDVYLYFSLGEEKLQRWFNNSLEDMGPDLGAGLPSERAGRITALLSYPGRVYQAVSHPDNFASVMMLKGSSQHEVYRAPIKGEEISALHHQSFPGDVVGRLWFDQGGDIVRLPITTSDPSEHSDYKFTFQGLLETGWYYGQMRDIIKIFKSLKVWMDWLHSGTNATLDYKVDDDTAWTAVTGTFDSPPSEEVDFASTYPTAKRLKYRLGLNTTLWTDTMEITATLIEAYGVTDIKYVYNLPVVIADEWEERDLQGNEQQALGYTASASTAITKLRAWASAGTPLTLHSNVAAMDDGTVVLEGPPLKPIRINNKAQEERYLLNVTCRDI